MIRKIVFASGNKGKLKEVKTILGEYGFEVFSPHDMGIENFDVDENGETFSDNARIKADSLFKLLGEKIKKGEYAVLADDSGLEVFALDMRPGIRSARYAEGDDKARYMKILDEMGDLPDDKRKARFTCSVVYKNADFCIGMSASCEGEIGREPSGDNGFGYDPIFIPNFSRKNGNTKTFAEYSEEEKNGMSHRAGALVHLARFLINEHNMTVEKSMVRETLKKGTGE